MDIQKVGISAGVGVLSLIGLVCGSSVCALANKVSSLSFVKKSSAVAINGGLSTFVATMITLSCDEDSMPKALLLSTISIVAFTSLASPKLSKSLSKSNISYLESLAFTVSGISTGIAIGGLVFIGSIAIFGDD